MKPLAFTILVAFFSLPGQALPTISTADSLRQHRTTSPADTNRVKQLLARSERFACPPGQSVGYPDSALLLARQAATLSESLQYHQGEGMGYLFASKALRKKGDFQRSKAYLDRAMRIFRQHNYPALVGHAYAEWSHYYTSTGEDIGPRIRLNAQALPYLMQAGDHKKEADVRKEQGDLLQLQGHYRQSLQELHEALRLYRSVGYPNVQGVYDLLGFVSTKVGDYQAGLTYGLQAVKTAHQRGDTSLQLCTIYNRVGLTCQALGQGERAQAYFEKSLQIARRHHHAPSVVYLAGNLSSLLLGAGKAREALRLMQDVAAKYPPADAESRIILAARLMDCYRELNQYERARPHYRRVVSLTEANGAGSPGLAVTYQSVIQFLLASRQYEMARKYLTMNQLICRQQGSAGSLAMNYLQWFKLDSALGKFPAALGSYQRYVTLRDSLLTERKNQQVAQLAIQYETEKKDQELRLKEKNIQLLTEQGKLQAQKLERARMIRNGSIAGALMLVLLLGLSYNRYRLKQHSNELLAAKQLEINQKNQSLEQVVQQKNELLDEKEWMLKEIHHRVRNNLQIVISLLNSQAASVADKAALSPLRESQHRVQAMALIHQKLYQSEQIARVDMASYVHELIVYLRDAYVLPGPVRFELSVQPLALDVTLAVPLGLIINEAVTNSLKYAFPADRSGTVSLCLRQLPPTSYHLCIADDGVGLPADVDPARSGSLGLTLMRGLAQQLGGQLTITSQSGVHVALAFEAEPLVPGSKRT